ncbi:MAG: polysaccharide deacetylase family protein [Nocardioidaceae bacterium]
MTIVTSRRHQEAFARGELIRVVNYHSTPAGGREALERELADYAEAFSPVTFADLDQLFETGEWHKDKPGVLPVFYEGYRNSHSVAAPAAEKAGLTAWFPVATAFLSTPVEHQEAFARAHWIYLVEEDLQGDRIAMTWEELAELAERHEVFPHTASHQGFDTVFDDHELEREVIEPKRLMEQAIGRPARAFAWLHGSPFGRSPRHDDAILRAGYDYVFSNTMIQRLPR